MTRVFPSIFFLAALLFVGLPARAQLVGTDTTPGSSCSGFPNGATRMTADPDHDGAQVILICDGTTWNAMAGIGTACGPDITGGTTVTGTFTHMSGGAGGNAALIDNTATPAADPAGSNGSQYFRIDFGSGNSRHIRRLSVTTNTAFGYGTAITYNFDWSDNGIMWTTVSTFTIPAGTGVTSEFTIPASAAHRYWRAIYTSGATGFDTWLREIEMFETASCGGGASGDSLWNLNGNDIYYSSGNVGIGTPTPSEKLQISGNLRIDTGEIKSSGGLTIHPGVVDGGTNDWIIFTNNDSEETMRINADGNVGINTVAPGATLDNGGSTALSGDITPSQITSNQNNYNPAGLSTASTLLLSSDASRNITGIQGGADGRVLNLINVGSNPIVLVNASGSSTAANRFSIGSNLTIAANQGVTLWYEAGSTNRWRAVTGIGATGGGALDDLSDVTLTSPANNDILRFDGSAWKNVNIGTAMTTTTMVVNWPDAIICNFTSPNFGKIVIPLTIAPYIDGRFTYRWSNLGSGLPYDIWFNSNGTFNMYQNITTSDCNKSIAQLYTDGQAFNFVGGAGGGVSFPLIASPVGSASAPAYSFTSDTNTGMYAATADKLSLATGGTERIRVTSTGMSINQAADPSVALDVTGDIEYSGTIADVSDIRLKNNVAPLQGSLAKVTGLEGISFRMKDDPQGRTEFGFSAQDVRKIYPELVLTADDEMGTMSVNYVGLIAPMVEAIKELKTENDELKTTNKGLLRRIEAIERELAMQQ
jgi:hypothetical protein